MNRLFVPYDVAIKLKDKGFDEPCLGYYDPEGLRVQPDYYNRENKNSLFPKPEITNSPRVSAPIYTQVFDWFRKKHKLGHWIDNYYGKRYYCKVVEMKHPHRHKKFPDTNKTFVFDEYKSYQEAEEALVRRMVEWI